MDRELEELEERRNITVEPMDGGAEVEHGWANHQRWSWTRWRPQKNTRRMAQGDIAGQEVVDEATGKDGGLAE